MEERIRCLRKSLELNQTEFGKRIGVKQGTMAGYETGVRYPIDAVIQAICREFNVNEDWLRNGEGPMYLDLSPDAEFDLLCTEIQFSDDEFIKNIMRAYWKLDDKEKSAVQKLFDYIPRKEKGQEIS